VANSLLPQEILPQHVPFVGKDGKIDKNWWLFLYNLSQRILGDTATDDPQILSTLADLESGADEVKDAADIRELQTLFSESENPSASLASVEDVNAMAWFWNEPDPVTVTGGAGAPTNAQYVTLANDASLSAERVLTAGAGISIVDGGANSTVTISATGAAVTAAQVVLMTDESSEDHNWIPGPQGPAGTAGATGAQGPLGPAVYLEAESGEDGAMGPPGLTGATGSTGSTGPAGASGFPIYIEPEAAEDALIIPGPAGVAGAAGATGAAGASGFPIYIEPEAPEDPIMIPGPQGIQGPAGGGGSGTTGTVVVDFGTGKLDTSAVVTGHAAIVSGSRCNAWLSGVASANNLVDAGFAEPLDMLAGDIVVGTGFTVYVFCRSGRAFGQYNVNWSWS
jgi:hypothetical protein